MARLWQSGFELNSSTSGVEWDTCTNVTVQTSTVRSGTYAGKVTSPVSGTGRFFKQQFASANGNGPYFARAYLNFSVLPNAETTILSLFESGGTQPLTVTVDSSGVARLYFNDAATLVGSASITINANQWYRFEVRFDKTPAGGSQVVELLIDGWSLVNKSNATITNGVEILGIGFNMEGDTASSGTLFIDDVAINDSTGSFQTTYPGPGKIIQQNPASQGDNNAWVTQVGGTAGSANNYTRENQIPPDDATSYNSDSTVGHIDDYGVSASGIGSTDTVNVVCVGTRYASVSASSNSSYVVRLKAVSGGTVSEGSTITPNATAYKTNANAAPKNYPLVSYQKPGTSSPWTQADLDAAQIGIHLTANSTNNDRVTSVWMSVDYNPNVVAKDVQPNNNNLGLVLSQSVNRSNTY